MEVTYMKKFVKIFAVALLVALTVTALVACGYSGDPDKDSDTLESRGYRVYLSKVALGDQTARLNAWKTNLDDFTIAELAKPETLEKLTGDVVSIRYYKDADAAKSHYEQIKSDEEGHNVSLQGAMIVITYSVKGQDVQKLSTQLVAMSSRG